MKRFILILSLTCLIMGSLFVFRDSNKLSALESTRFILQVAAYSTTTAAQKEIERLHSLNIKAQVMTKEDRNKKRFFAVYIDQYKTKEEAMRYGNQLINEGIIQSFLIFPLEGKKIPPPKASELPPPPKTSSKQNPKPALGKNQILFGPIVIKEEEATILMTISLNQKVFPKISTQKTDENSRLFVTFKNIDKMVVPVDFRKDQNRALLSFSVAQKGTDCTFILVLNPSFNYEVSQNYFEKEKIYALRIRWESTTVPAPISEK